MRSVEITPEPSEEEQKAILAALAAEEAEQRGVSDWAGALLPARDGEGDSPYPE